MGWFDGWIAYNVLRRRMRKYEERLRRLEYRMATFEEIVSDLASVTDNLADRIEEYERTNAQLRQAVVDNDTARAAALSAQAAEHAAVLGPVVDKLRNLGVDTSNPVPDTQPVESPVDTAPSAPDSTPETPAQTEDGTPVVVEGSQESPVDSESPNGPIA